MWSTDTYWFEVAMVSAIFAIGNIVFGHFEELTPKWKRLSKFVVFIIVVVLLSQNAGRAVAFGFLGILALFMIYVHGFVLPRKGINGWTREPREKYYEFRGWKKKQ